MPRTKYIAVFFAVLTIVLLITFVCFTLRDAGASLALMPTQRAMAIESLQSRQSPSVVVEEDTTREMSRQSLIEKLRQYIPPAEPVALSQEPPDATITTSASMMSEDEQTTHIACANGVVSGSGISSWGAVNVTRAEGARMITSLALNDGGAPLHALQLVDTPLVTGQTGCLPEGMIGVALDGRIIDAGVSFRTNAEGIAGYALDGFGIFGAFENGSSLMSSDLDECHGHVHAIVWNGVPTSMYHYHVTDDAPYTLGCFRGTPSSIE